MASPKTKSKKEEKKPQSETAINFLGILRCPLHKGFVEFEYQEGDRVIELKKHVLKIWGTPKAIGTRREYGFWDTGHWVILCQDEESGYVVLLDNDLIPIKPIPAPRFKRQLFQDFRRFGLPQGVIHDDEIYYRPDLHSDEEQRDKQFSVKLLALVAINGG